MKVTINMFLFRCVGIMLLVHSLAACASGPVLPGAARLGVEGASTPPVGLVDFCVARPHKCEPSPGGLVPVPLSETRWQQLALVNATVNRAITSMPDQDAFGRVDYWTDNTLAGDCDDYVMTKRAALLEQGWPPRSLMIALLDTEQGERHVVLLAATEAGDFVLDNRFDDVRPWQELDYRWIARQAPDDPLRWYTVADSRPVTGSAPAAR